MKNLAEVSKQEQLEFINSFDQILSDLDGVIWLRYKIIPGSSECINKLKKLGKEVGYVSNNSTIPLETVKQVLDSGGFNADLDDIVIPVLAIKSYLKKIRFNKVLYVIGTSHMKEEMRNAGFTLAPDVPLEIPESLSGVLSHIGDDPNIQGVVVDIDINLTYTKLQKAITYLKRENCLFISGCGDARIPIGDNNVLIGPRYFIKALIDISGREPLQIAKPQISYNEYIVERFKIEDPKRVLFIGDSVNEDLNLATKCGYQKLLVLSGVTTKDHLNNWEYPEEYKPQYYVESLKDLSVILNRLFPNEEI